MDAVLYYYIKDPATDQWAMVIPNPTPETKQEIKAQFLERATRKGRRIRFNQGRLRHALHELAVLERTPLRQPQVIQPTTKNPFSVQDLSDQMAIKAQRAAEVARLKEKIEGIEATIKELEEVESALIDFVNNRLFE